MLIRTLHVVNTCGLPFLISYDRYRGVVSLINIQGGTLSKGLLPLGLVITIHPTTHTRMLGGRIQSCHTRKKYEIIDIGIMHPEEVSTSHLRAGQVGYIGV